MTVPGVYSPSQAERVDATIRAAAESDGVIPDAVKVEAMARALFECRVQVRMENDARLAADGGWPDRFKQPTDKQYATAALNALRALEGEN